MSGLDETLARWRRETEQLEPPAALMAELQALAVAQTAASAAPVVAAKAAGVTKAVVLIVAVAVLGIAGAVLVSMMSRAPAPCESCAPSATDVTAPTAAPVMIAPATAVPEQPSAPKTPEAAVSAPMPAMLQELRDPKPRPDQLTPKTVTPKTPPVPDQLTPKTQPVPDLAIPKTPPAPDALTPSTPEPAELVAMVPSPGAGRLAAAKGEPPAPERLVRAVERLAATCAAQRNVLVELVREAAASDPDAAAAALTRWTLLCRAISGPALDGHRWFWPWAAPSSAGTACNTVMTDPSCDDGDNITQSIAAASRCVLGTTPGSCARRGALLQAVFAQCEAFTHRPDAKSRAAVDEVLSRLTAEFGDGLAPAAWCLNPAAKAEAQRRR